MNIFEINVKAKEIADELIKKYHWYTEGNEWFVVDENFNIHDDYKIADPNRGETWFKNVRKHTYDLIPMKDNVGEWVLTIGDMSSYEPISTNRKKIYYIDTNCSLEENIILNEMRIL